MEVSVFLKLFLNVRNTQLPTANQQKVYHRHTAKEPILFRPATDFSMANTRDTQKPTACPHRYLHILKLRTELNKDVQQIFQLGRNTQH